VVDVLDQCNLRSLSYEIRFEMSKSSHTEGEKLQVLTPSSPSASTIAPPRLLREISISADNIPTLCLDDYPIAATPLMQQGNAKTFNQLWGLQGY
jgi:hypothetical protein